MHEVVKYHNDMNKISFAGFNEKELNVFFSLVFLAKEKGTTELTIPFSELRILSNNDLDNHKKRFLNILKTLNKKLLALNSEIQIGEITYLFTLFNVFGINEKEKVLTVKVNEIFSYILNDFIGNFTKFELENFVNLKSSYSKNMFKLLKQWETVKHKEFELDELKTLLNAPIGYDTFKFNQKIIKQLEKELPEFFPNLEINKKKKGRKIIGYEFSWGQKHPDIEIPEDKVVEISEELAKAFEKASKNRYIQPFLTEKGKSDLLEAFGEEALIRGLPFAYKTIKKEFKSLAYLTRVIETGAKEQKVVIKTVKKDKFDIEVDDIQNDNIRQTSFDELPKEKKKIEITEEEFEVLYKKYLEENNASDSPFVRKGFAMPYSIKKENAEEK